MTTTVRRSKLALRRLASAPPVPPAGGELIYANASGTLRQLDDLGNDTAVATADGVGLTEGEVQALIDATVGPLQRRSRRQQRLASSTRP